MKILIIIPAYNEAENIKRVVDNLISNYPEYDYIIVNDGSKDHTAEICHENNFNILTLPINLGIGGGVQTGYLYALQNNYDIAIQMDGDGQHEAKYLKELINPILSGQADVVIGSRFITNQGFQSSTMRRMGISLLSKIIYLCSRVKVKDVTSGFRAVNKRFIEIYANEYAQDYPEPEAIIAAVMNDGKIKEVPVVMNERLGGESSITLLKSIYYMIKVSIIIILYRITFDRKRGRI